MRNILFGAPPKPPHPTGGQNIKKSRPKLLFTCHCQEIGVDRVRREGLTVYLDTVNRGRLHKALVNFKKEKLIGG